MQKEQKTVEETLKGWFKDSGSYAFSYEAVKRLYDYLLLHSELSGDAILHELHISKRSP